MSIWTNIKNAFFPTKPQPTQVEQLNEIIKNEQNATIASEPVEKPKAEVSENPIIVIEEPKVEEVVQTVEEPKVTKPRKPRTSKVSKEITHTEPKARKPRTKKVKDENN